MNLDDDIKQATVLDKASTKKKPKFYRLKQPSQANRDRQMNNREVPTPRNLNILEDTYVDNTNCETNLSYNKVNYANNYSHDIAATIREIHGGQDLSNRYLEEDWKKNLKSMNNTEEIQSSSLSEDSSACSNSPEVSNWTDNHVDVPKRKFLKNAALMGLSGTNEEEEEEEENLYQYEYEIEAIPHEEDSDVFVHPLQKGLDEQQYNHIDFSIPRLAKKKRITPQEYYLLTTDDKFFEFKKDLKLGNKSSKNNSI